MDSLEVRWSYGGGTVKLHKLYNYTEGKILKFDTFCAGHKKDKGPLALLAEGRRTKDRSLRSLKDFFASILAHLENFCYLCKL